MLDGVHAVIMQMSGPFVDSAPSAQTRSWAAASERARDLCQRRQLADDASALPLRLHFNKQAIRPTEFFIGSAAFTAGVFEAS